MGSSHWVPTYLFSFFPLVFLQHDNVPTVYRILWLSNMTWHEHEKWKEEKRKRKKREKIIIETQCVRVVQVNGARYLVLVSPSKSKRHLFSFPATSWHEASENTSSFLNRSCHFVRTQRWTTECENPKIKPCIHRNQLAHHWVLRRIGTQMKIHLHSVVLFARICARASATLRVSFRLVRSVRITCTHTHAMIVSEHFSNSDSSLQFNVVLPSSIRIF